MSRVAARVLLVWLGILVMLSAVGPAAAHVGGGAAGSDFDGRVLSVRPEVPGLSVRILQFGDELELVNRTDREVLVPGYSDEPYLRIGPDGVWRNARSPATYINLDRYGRTTLPARADAAAEPVWEQISTEPHYVWHDHRTHWMSENLLPPQVAAEPDRSHTVFEWTVPLVYDGGTTVDVEGVLTWSPPPPPGLVWPLAAVPALLAVAAGLLCRTPRLLGVLIAAGAAAALWHAVATPVPPLTVGTHAGAIGAALLPAGTAVVVAVLGMRAVRRGRGALAGLLAVVLGWLLLVQGLPDVDVLWSANVLSAGPEAGARAAVAALVSLGIGLVPGGIAAARRFREDAAPVVGAAPPAAAG